MIAENSDINASDLSGIYQDIAEVIGIEATLKLYDNFKGLQITFPKKLYSIGYVRKQPTYPNADIKQLSKKLGYTERRLRQIKKQEGDKDGEEK